MSTSLLYHAFGVRGYRYVKTEYGEGAVTFTIEQPRESYRCPVCGSDDVIGRGQSVRRFRTVPIGGKPATSSWPSPGWSAAAAVPCGRCGSASPIRASATPKPFKRYALELSRHMTIQDVAEHLDISWDVIKEIQKEDLQRRFGKAEAEAPAADRHRRDFHGQGAPLPDGRPGPGERGGGPRRSREKAGMP